MPARPVGIGFARLQQLELRDGRWRFVGAGGITLFIGSITGILLWATASSEDEDRAPSGVCTTVDVTNEAQRWSGILITGGSIITGLILITRGDSASVELVPGAPTAFRGPGRLDAARDLGARSSTALSGLTLVGRF